MIRISGFRSGEIENKNKDPLTKLSELRTVYILFPC